MHLFFKKLFPVGTHPSTCKQKQGTGFPIPYSLKRTDTPLYAYRRHP